MKFRNISRTVYSCPLLLLLNTVYIGDVYMGGGTRLRYIPRIALAYFIKRCFLIKSLKHTKQELFLSVVSVVLLLCLRRVRI